MLHFRFRYFYKKAAGAHADHDNFLFIRQIIAARAGGFKLVHLVGRASVHRFIHILASHAGDIYTVHIGKLQIILIKIPSERAVQGSHLAVRPDHHGSQHFFLLKCHNFGRAAADIDSYSDTHIFILTFPFFLSESSPLPFRFPLTQPPSYCFCIQNDILP